MSFRYKRIAHLELVVGDLAVSTRFYNDLIGLELVRSDEGRSVLRCSDLPQNLVLRQGLHPGISVIALELENASQLSKAERHLEACGLAPRIISSAELQEVRMGGGLRVIEPHCGLTIELYVEPELPSAPYVPGHTSIARLGHLGLNVRDFDAVLDTFLTKLNFRVSDEIPGKVAFLRVFPNPYHHSFALFKAERNGHHHLNFMVCDIDDIGRAVTRLREANVPIVFGPGRHLPSGSIFLYFLDPDGLTAEYSFGMEQFEETDARAPRQLEYKREVLDVWGSVPAAGYAEHGAIASGGSGMTAPAESLASANPEIGKSIAAHGIATNYLEKGTGEPVVLIHGSGAGVSAFANWNGIMPALAERFHVYAPDMVGFGYTEVPASVKYFDKSLWVDHILGFLDALGIERVSLIGNSFGGALSVALAAAHPDRVARLVLMGAVGLSFPITPGLEQAWGYQPSEANMRRLIETFAYDASLVTDAIVRSRHQASLRPGVQEQFSRMFPAPRQSHVEALATSEEQVRSLDLPVLLVHGRQDRVIPVEVSCRYAELFPRAELHIFNRCGHWTQIEKRQRFIDLVIPFLSADQAVF